MRIGGPLNFNASGPFPIYLGSGGYIYPPAGQYLFTLGPQTVLQWQDPLYGWRNYCAPGAEIGAISLDGYNYRLINLSGTVVGASITNAGSGGTNGIGPTQTGTTLGVAGPGGTGQTAKGYVIVGGSLPALSIANAGSGFVVPPLILIDPPPAGGIQAEAFATITTGGALSSVTLTNIGAGYTNLPNVYVVPQFLDYPGSPALPFTIPSSPTPVAPNFPPGNIFNAPGGGVTVGLQQFVQGLQQAFPVTSGALVNFGAGVLGGSGTLTGIVMTDFGSAYTGTSVPAVSFAGTSLGAAAATALMNWCVVTAPVVTFATLAAGTPVESTLGYLTDPTFAQNSWTPGTIWNNNNFLFARPYRGRLVTSAAVTATDDPGFGFQTALGTGSFGALINQAAATGTATFAAPTMGGIVDVTMIQMFIND